MFCSTPKNVFRLLCVCPSNTVVQSNISQQLLDKIGCNPALGLDPSKEDQKTEPTPLTLMKWSIWSKTKMDGAFSGPCQIKE